MPVNLIIRNPLDWDALAIARNANGANRRELSDYVRFLKAQAVWTDLTFFRDFANAKSLNHSFGPNINFTRNSVATYFDAGGTLRTAAANEPRFDHDPSNNNSLGLLIEEARTNSLRNSQAGGSTNGVIGSGGVIPTHWATADANTNGNTTEILGTGTEDGLAYIDIKASGTPTSNGSIIVAPELATQVAALNGQTWVSSFYVRLVGGATTNAVTSLTTRAADSLGAAIAGQDNVSNFTPTSAALKTQRVVTPATAFSSASVAFVRPFIRIAYTNGNPIDITLRIAAPQLEQGAFPTSYIPTTTAAVTRQADSALVDPISSFYNASTGTLFAEFNRYQVLSSGKFFGFTNTATNAADYNTLEAGASVFDAQRYIGVTATPTTEWQITFSSTTANTVYRMAGAYAANDIRMAQNGTLGTADTSASIPPVNAMGIGCLKATFTAFGQLNGHIRKVAYYPKSLSNALLQTLTT